MNSQILYFIETSPIREKIFNSYMQDAVNLYNEQFKAEARGWDGRAVNCEDVHIIFANLYLNQKWLEMVRGN